MREYASPRRMSERQADVYADLMRRLAAKAPESQLEHDIVTEELVRLGDTYDEFRADARGLTTAEFREAHPGLVWRKAVAGAPPVGEWFPPE